MLKRILKKITPATILAVFAAVGTLYAQDVFRVITNYPNPFDSRCENTIILYTLHMDSDVKVDIYDLFGNLVKEYPAERQASGIRMVLWDGSNDSGQKVAKGGYICVVNVKSDSILYSTVRKIGVIH
ncbi:MAG: hypothetical protein JW803_07275 [Endomicrobiales bacterium]|nr:hypothetical protein [Endomicrobiales bacterium]